MFWHLVDNTVAIVETYIVLVSSVLCLLQPVHVRLHLSPLLRHLNHQGQHHDYVRWHAPRSYANMVSPIQCIIKQQQNMNKPERKGSSCVRATLCGRVGLRGRGRQYLRESDSVRASSALDTLEADCSNSAIWFCAAARLWLSLLFSILSAQRLSATIVNIKCS